jgi:phage-related protein (TIGR01555 family)
MTSPDPNQLVHTEDSWVNPTTGVGGSSDKSAGFTFVPGTDRLWSGMMLAELYEVDDICARIVDALPSAAFERGWRLEENLPPEQSEAVRDALDHFRVQQQVQRTRRWARLYGGAALYIGSDDGPQEAPLQYGGRLHFLQPYERDELQPCRYYDDPLSPKFGEASHYRLTPIRSVATGPSIIIHESRLIVMQGVDTTPRKRAQNNGWGTSVLMRSIKAIQQFYAAHAIVLSLLGDANQNVFKWKGLADMLLAGKEDMLEARMRLMDRVRSTVHGIAVDADEEDFVRSQINVTGMDSVIDKYSIRLAASVPMPVTVLMGQSPAGMNATGESDLRNWGSQVDVEKRDVFTPALEKCVRVLFRARNGPTAGQEPSTWSIKFPSMWAPTPLEDAQIRSVNAQTDQLYVDMQVLRPAQVAKARFMGDTEQQTPLVTAADIAAMEAALLGGGGGGNVPRATAEGDELPDAEAVSRVLSKPSSPDVAEVDSEDESEDQPIDVTVMQLAAKMTEHGIAKCEHGMANVCERCGIERIRDFEPGPDGQAIWTRRWRPIGTTGFWTPPEPETEPAAAADA